MRRLAYGAICFLLGAAATVAARPLPYTNEEFNRYTQHVPVFVALRGGVEGPHVDLDTVADTESKTWREVRRYDRDRKLRALFPVAEVVEARLVFTPRPE